MAAARMIIRDAPSPNHDERPAGEPIDTLVLHYTGMRTAEEAIGRLRDPASRVSAHYVVEEDGTIWRLVPEERRAWHAGVSHWRGREALNGRSIGIEAVNPGHGWGYRPFPALQMAALCDLCLDIIARRGIAARDVVAHSDVSPDRKQDPGELFDWEGLAANGVGLWPRTAGGGASAQLAETAAARSLLGAIGYRTDLPLPTLVSAFQRRWRPERVDGALDGATLRRLIAVAALHDEDASAVIDAKGAAGA
jgi:N-acetylmuramoyl-L-alanine amidase